MLTAKVAVGVALVSVPTVILPVVEFVKDVALIKVAPEPVKPQVPVEVPKLLSVSAPTVTFETISAFAPLATTKEFEVAPSAAVLFNTKVPAETVVVPVYVFVPDNSSVPVPAFVRFPDVLIIPLIVKSVTAVVSSATVKVRVVALVNATGQLMVAPTPVPVILLTVTFPPRVNTPAPDRVEPVAPHSKVIAVGESTSNPPLARVAPPFIANVPLMVVAALNVFVELPDMVKLE